MKRQLGRIWNAIETSDIDIADASDRIKEHRERKERLEDAAADARAILSERRAYLDDVSTIAAYAKDMKDFLQESELDRAQGVHRVFRQGDHRHSRRRPDTLHHPHFSIDTKN